MGEDVRLRPKENFTASTDMGNVCHEVPGFHGAFAIPSEPDAALHSYKFADAAGKPAAHEAAIKSAKGMAMLALRVIADEALAGRARKDFDHREQ